MLIELEVVQAGSDLVAGASGFEVDSAVAFHARPSHGTADGAGDGVDRIAKP
jgi:hypothetical protein